MYKKLSLQVHLNFSSFAMKKKKQLIKDELRCLEKRERLALLRTAFILLSDTVRQLLK